MLHLLFEHTKPKFTKTFFFINDSGLFWLNIISKYFP